MQWKIRRDPWSHENRSAGSEVHRDCSYFLDLAGDFATRNQGKRESVSFDAVSDPEIQVIEGAGTDADQHLVGAHFRPRQLAPLQRLGSSMVTDPVGEHPEIVAATLGHPFGEPTSFTMGRCTLRLD